MESDCSLSLELHMKDKKSIQKLEKKLLNCYIEIGYLHDLLVHDRNLELKKRSKDEDFKYFATQIEELEEVISSTALESQCEVESVRLEMIALEERCLQAESLSRQFSQDKSEIHELLKEYELQLYEAQDTINLLEMENNELKAKIQGSEGKFCRLHCKFDEHLSKCSKNVGMKSGGMHGESHKDLLSFGIKDEHSSLSRICTCEDGLCPLISKLTLLNDWDEKVKDEMRETTYQMHESELLIEKLKEELKYEKMKAREEADDLTQAMAELRYEITGMLQDEYKHRASIEQASLRRIQDLEEQVRKEQRKSFSAIRILQELYKLSEVQCNEVQLSEAPS